MLVIHTVILYADFVEQYTRMKKLRDYAMETDIRIVRIEVTEDHPWLEQQAKELGDHILIVDEGFQDEYGAFYTNRAMKDAQS